MKAFLRYFLLPLLFGALGAFLVLHFYHPTTWSSHSNGGDSLQFSPSANGGSKAHALLSFEASFVEASRRAMPSVVHVHTLSQVEMASPYRGTIIEFFFGPQPGVYKPVRGSGSGVIVSDDGLIVTNYHVVKGAQAMEITLYDQRKYPARLVARDPAIDLALLKVEAHEPLTPIEFGDSESLRVGNWVLAIGNPFNLENTVTAGIVSSLARNINLQSGRVAMESLIQVDAAVNPGNSGGALVDMEGRLVGINTAIASPTGTFAGYAFSIPETIVERFLKENRAGANDRERGYLGVHLAEMTPYLARQLTDGKRQGVVVVGIFPGGAAERVGIQQGDVIIAVNGKQVNSINELQRQVGRYSAGESVTLQFLREGKLRKVEIELAPSGE